MIEVLNQNAGAVTAGATVALLLVTAFYAWTTHRLFREAETTRLLSGEPRVVAYLRINETHTNIAQLHIANLSGAAAIEVSATLERITEWPEPFRLQDSSILRDLSVMRPHELVRFDLGSGDDLLRDGKTAVFNVTIAYQGLDRRAYQFGQELKVESVHGFSGFKIYSLDDVARHLHEMAKALKMLAGASRPDVDSHTSQR